MAENTNARTRLLVLVEILTMYSDENNILSLGEICDFLQDYGYEVSKRNVLADIKAINTTPIKIISVAKPKKGFYIVKNFSQDAIRLILEAVFSSDILSEDETEYIKKYLRRSSCIPTVDLILNTTLNLNSYAPKKKPSSEVIDGLRLAIRDKKQAVLTVSRSSPGDTFSDARKLETVTVNPVTLIVADGNIALIFTRDGTPKKPEFINMPRIEKVDVIKNEATEFTDDLVAATNYFDGSHSEVSYYFREWLLIRFRTEHIELIENRFSSPVQYRKDEKEGYCNAKVYTTFDDKLLGWLFALSDKVEIIAPQRIRQMFEEKAKNILK